MSHLTISRRVFIGSIAYLVTAPTLAFVPFAKVSDSALPVTTDGQFFTASELTILADIAEIMIPKTVTPGATDAHVIAVLDAMMLTWASTKTQTQFRQLIKQIQLLSSDTLGASYAKQPLEQRSKFIAELDKQAFQHPDTQISMHYRKFKNIVFHIYYTSKEANPDYQLIPGTYKGCVSADELSNKGQTL